MYCSRIVSSIAHVSRSYHIRIAGHTAAEMLDEFHDAAELSGGRKRTGEEAGIEGCPTLLQVQNMEKNLKHKQARAGTHLIRA